MSGFSMGALHHAPSGKQDLRAMQRHGSKLIDPLSRSIKNVALMVAGTNKLRADVAQSLIAQKRSLLEEAPKDYQELLESIQNDERTNGAMTRLGSSRQGLSELQRGQAEEKFGKNIAVDPLTVPPFWQIYLGQWQDFIVLLLLAAGIAMIATLQYEAGVLIFLILIGNAWFGASIEHQGQKRLADLVNSDKKVVTAIISGEEQTTDVTELYPGDVIQLVQGQAVPADCFILQLNSEGPTRSDANLNGESDPIELKPHFTPLKPGEHAHSQFPPNAVPAGSTMLTGSITAMVYQTGKKTMAGQTQAALASGDEEDPEMTKKVNKLVALVGYASIMCGVVVIAVGLPTKRGGDPTSDTAFWLQIVGIGVGLIAAAVPEALPIVKTAVMSNAMINMTKNHAQMQSTKATENSAGITVLCSDKTGTLTEGIMTFYRFVVGGTQKIIDIEFGGDKTPSDFALKMNGAPFDPKTLSGAERENCLNGFSCIMNQCAATSMYDAEDKWTSTGSSNFIDIAASKFNASTIGQTLSRKFADEAQAVDHPFDSSVKFAASVYKDEQAGCYVAIVKGASDKPAFEALMTAEDKQARDAASDEGLRLLALLTRKVPFSALGGQAPAEFFAKANILDQLTFCGFAAFQDPPRQDAKDAVTVCRDGAGIVVKMITGDNPRTALSIAKQIGIATKDQTLETGVIHMQDPLILRIFAEHAELEQKQEDAKNKVKDDNKDLIKFTKEDNEKFEAHTMCIAHWITTRNVIARALPLHKRTIVRTLQKNGEIVAMTGDGVNDAAALKAAHLGVAMDNGADVTKEAADMVLRDCKFSTIVNVAIKGGRVISVNLKKFIYLLGSTNVAEVLFVLIATILDLPAPVDAILILYVNLITDSSVALALGYERPEAGVMDEGPENPKDPLLSRAMYTRIAFHSMWSTSILLGLYIGMLQWYTNTWDGKAPTVSPNTPVTFGNDIGFKTNGADFIDGMRTIQVNDAAYEYNVTRTDVVNATTNTTSVETLLNTAARDAAVSSAQQTVDDFFADGIAGARTAVLILMVTSEMLRGITCKNFDRNDFSLNNPLLNFSVVGGIGLTVAIALIPEVNGFFSLGDMDYRGWLLAIGISFTVFPLDALLKCLVPRTPSVHHHARVEAHEVPNPAYYGLSVTPKDVSLEVSTEAKSDGKQSLLH